MTKAATYAQRTKPLEQRFWEKVQRKGESECWSWASAFGSKGYGIFWVGGTRRNDMAHRVAYELTHTKIPEGLLVRHSCDNPSCVNPNHLLLGTQKDNVRDALERNRAAVGERNKGGGNVLSAEKARGVYAMRGRATMIQTAAMFNIGKTTVGHVWNGRTWWRETGATPQPRRAAERDKGY